MTDIILTAGTIVTMDANRSRAEAVAVSGGKIVAVGTLADCQAALPGATVHDTKAKALLPGFIESHSHPVVSGLSTQAPAVSIAPWNCPTWDDVLAVFKKTAAATGTSAMIFNGFDALLHGRPSPKAPELDEIFGDREVVIIDNSGHGVYFTTALMKKYGWDTNPPADPIGASYGRNADGSLNGQGLEAGAVLNVAQPIMNELGGNPLVSAMGFYRVLAEGGITSATEHTYNDELAKAYIAIGSMPENPLRISLYHVSIEDTCAANLTSPLPEEILVKQGIKLWADGSPWIGNINISFPYLKTQATDNAGIDGSKAGAVAMNYTREQLDATLDKYATSGWQMSFHVNGDSGLDIVLDAYEHALNKYNLVGTDHRWRVEHVGAGRKDQFKRAGEMGVHISMSPFQFIYWGDLLDGQMFAPENGARWQAFRDAFDAGVPVSFHNDGSVSPPLPLLNVQAAVTRTTINGNLHGSEQAISIDEAMCAETINAAKLLKREHLVGSIEVGKLADFVELSADPYAVDPHKIYAECKVKGTWLGGKRVDLDAFMNSLNPAVAAEHTDLHKAAHKHPHNC